MASIKLTVNTNFADASKDIKSLGKLTEAETKRMDKGLKNLSVEQLEKFERNLTRTTAAVKATKGPTEAMRTQQRMLSAQIQRSIKAGIDPMDESLAKLRDQYDKVTKEVEDNRIAQEKSNKTSAVTAASFLYIGKQVFNAAKQVMQFAKDLTDAAGIQEEAEAKLAQTIKATGQAAGLTTKELTDMATALQNTTKFGDEAIIGAESLLLTFKDIGGDVFPRALESILDVSEAMGQDLKSSTVQLGKALNDPIGGISALTRVGIQFSDTQKEMIKGFVEAGDVASAQGVILEELESQFGGVAAAAADTASGSFVQLENATGDLKEAYGSLIADGMKPMNQALLEIVANWTEAINKQKEARDLMEDFKDGSIDTEMSLAELESTLEGLIKKQGQYGVGRKLDDEIEAVQELIDLYKIQERSISNNLTIEEARQKALENAAVVAAEKMAIEEKAAEALMTDIERQTAALQEQIDYWVQFREITGVQELINSLIEQRTELMNEQAEATTGLSEKLAILQNEEAVAHEERLATYQEFLEARMEQEGINSENRLLFLEEEQARVMELESLSYEERLAAKQAFEDERVKIAEEANQKSANSYAQYYDYMRALARTWRTDWGKIWKTISDISIAAADVTANAIDVIIDAIGEWGDESKEAAALQKALGIVSTIIATSSAMMKAYEALAGIPYVGPGLGAAAAAAVGVAGAIQISKIANTNVPSAETGGRFTVPDAVGATRSDNIGMNVNAGETVTVTPRGEEGAGMITVNNYLDREVIWSVIQDGLDAGEVQVNNDNIREAI